MRIDDATQSEHSPAVEDCWNRVGVKGDRSCPELPAVVHCHNCPVFAAAGIRLFERAPPEEIIAERTTQLAQDDAALPTDQTAVIVFRLAEEWLAMDVGVLVEVAEPRVVRRVPHRSNRLLMGLVNIRGELLPCISLCELLGLDADSPQASQPSTAPPTRDQPAATGRSAERLLVVESKRGRWVLAVDEVAGVERLEATAIRAAPATVAKGQTSFSQGVFSWRDARVGYLSHDRVFRCLEERIR